MKRIITITAVFLIIVFSIIMISPAAMQNEVEKVMPTQTIYAKEKCQLQHDIVDEVLSEIYPVLNINVLFFSTKQYNDLLYEQIGDHYFCYSTKSYEKQKGN